MKKLSVFIIFFCIVVFLSSVSFAASEAEVKNSLIRSVSLSMKKRNLDVTVNAEVLKKIGNPNGYYFVKLTCTDNKKNTVVLEQYVLSDGIYILPEMLRVNDMSSTIKEFAFDYAYTDIDVSGLSPIIGKKGAKNVIVEAADFQCPFCIETNKFLHQKLQNRDDVVVYIMHFPLRNIHPKADILAKIFEAGIIMGKNFGNELYDEVNHKMDDKELINKYGQKSGNIARFKELVSSEQVAEKIKNAEQQAKSLGINSAPTIFINGKKISGFDSFLIEKGISSFK